MTIAKLVTGRDSLSTKIVERLNELIDVANDHPYSGMAVVMFRPDGTSFVSTLGEGNRVALLGAVTDLQYTLAKSGGAP